MIDHIASKPFPSSHLIGLQVPVDFAAEVVAAAERDGVLFEDKLISWARMGALCDRIHSPRSARGRRK